MITGISVTWLGRPVELIIDCAGSAVDAFIEEAYYIDEHGGEVRVADIDQLQETYAGEIQQAAYEHMQEAGYPGYCAD